MRRTYMNEYFKATVSVVRKYLLNVTLSLQCLSQIVEMMRRNWMQA